MKTEQIALAQQMRSEGMTYQEVGDILGVSRSTARCNLDPIARERTREACASWRKRHIEEIAKYGAGYHKAHKAKRNACSSLYNASHKAEAAEWREINKDKRAEQMAMWGRNNADKVNVNTAAYRALKAAAFIGATIAQKKEIAEIYRASQENNRVRCYLCGKLIPLGKRHVDHIMPLSKGGAHRPSNLAVACGRCNQSKGAKIPEEIGLLL